MKNIIILLFVGLIALSGCKKWIDVSPKTNVKSEDLFESEAGFKSALIGIYGRMTKDETYGKNLTFGYVEELAQRYDNYAANITPSDQERATIYNYAQNTYSKNTLTSIWSELYKSIANINNLIHYVDKVGDDVLITPNYRNIIEGEAYALRAYHYLDLLRLWGPHFSDDTSAMALPWRSAFNSEKVSMVSANQIAQYIIKDLKYAEQLLVNDAMNFARDQSDLFLGQRQYRMNLFAVKALLARVYQYIGDGANATVYAKYVIDHSDVKLSSDNSLDVSLSKEALFCISMHDMENHVMGDWKNTTNLNTERWISTENIRSVFEFYTIGVNDIRYKNGYGFIHGMNRYMARKYLASAPEFKNIIPMIRLSEMYLIMAESGDPSQRHVYLNQLRNTRGISRLNNIGSAVSDAVMLDYINKEYQKEFFAEGQWFYFLKRHKKETFYRSPVSKMTYYVLPIPDEEIEFGNVNN